MTDELIELYHDLQRAYDLTLDRRKTLTGQAANMMSFTGIIETVLVGILITIATNKDARTLLVASPYYSVILLLAGLGFASYIATAVFSLLAFREPKWSLVPTMPDPNPLDSIQFFYTGKGKYSFEKVAMQLVQATELHQETNDHKYRYLQVAFFSLLLGIGMTAIAGFVLLSTT